MDIFPSMMGTGRGLVSGRAVEMLDGTGVGVISVVGEKGMQPAIKKATKSTSEIFTIYTLVFCTAVILASHIL